MIKKIIKFFKDLKRKKELNKKIKELRKRDPFIYK
tara:strand:- start:640 stop:744 length:105 start_codon:yes stop_codon:yes gene_type:complete